MRECEWRCDRAEARTTVTTHQLDEVALDELHALVWGAFTDVKHRDLAACEVNGRGSATKTLRIAMLTLRAHTLFQQRFNKVLAQETTASSHQALAGKLHGRTPRGIGSSPQRFAATARTTGHTTTAATLTFLYLGNLIALARCFVASSKLSYSVWRGSTRKQETRPNHHDAADCTAVARLNLVRTGV